MSSNHSPALPDDEGGHEPLIQVTLTVTQQTARSCLRSLNVGLLALVVLCLLVVDAHGLLYEVAGAVIADLLRQCLAGGGDKHDDCSRPSAG